MRIRLCILHMPFLLFMVFVLLLFSKAHRKLTANGTTCAETAVTQSLFCFEAGCAYTQIAPKRGDNQVLEQILLINVWFSFLAV